MQFLVVMKLKPGITREKLAPIARVETQKAWDLVAAGVMRTIHYIAGGGAVMLLETPDRAQAESHINALPIVEAGLVDTELLELAPYTGFAALFAAPAS